MRFSFFILFFVAIPSFLFSKDSLRVLLIELDNAVLNSAGYQKKKEERITEIKKEADRTAVFSVDRYIFNMQLFKQYNYYVSDSAIHYLNKNIEIAEHLKDDIRKNECMITLAFLMAGSSGMYTEAKELLQSIPRHELTADQLTEYYRAFYHLYNQLSQFTQDKKRGEKYRKSAEFYKDSLVNSLPSDSELYIRLKEERLREAGKYKEAFAENDMRLSTYEPGTSGYALATFHRSLIYKAEGRINLQKYFLALSALSDIQSATRDHASLWLLAEILFAEGDIERAYNYIRFSWNETVLFNARIRSQQSAGILSIIDQNYREAIKDQNIQLRNYLLVISVLLLFLAGALFYNYNQRKKLADARKDLQQVNNELKELNVKLNSANLELSESNRIKEEYIGRFINLCSAYIEKLSNYRNTVSQKIKNGEIDELLKITRSQKALDKELRELHENFDNAFLQIFPDFVNKFNQLLLPDQPIILKKDELLNTELRVFALIRLGINDSSKIAEFLSFSVNTIYNCRAKVKNKAAVPRDDFEEMVKKIR